LQLIPLTPESDFERCVVNKSPGPVVCDETSIGRIRIESAWPSIAISKPEPSSSIQGL
jgi:hypothetical protein